MDLDWTPDAEDPDDSIKAVHELPSILEKIAFVKWYVGTDMKYASYNFRRLGSKAHYMTAGLLQTFTAEKILRLMQTQPLKCTHRVVSDYELAANFARYLDEYYDMAQRLVAKEVYA